MTGNVKIFSCKDTDSKITDKIYLLAIQSVMIIECNSFDFFLMI